MSDTPRTSSKWEELCCSGQSWYTIAEYMKEDCQDLERELNAVTEQRDRLAEALWNMLNQEHGSAIKAGILLRSLNLQYLNPNEL
jgi:hypothetical protein